MDNIKIVNGSINSRLLSVYNWLLSLGFYPADIRQQMLKTYVPLVSGTNRYKVPLCADFNVITGDTTQVQIGKNDAFAPVAVSMVTRKAVGTNYAVSEVATFEDRTIFNAASGGSGLTENENIRGLYHGSKLTLDVENDAVLSDVPADLFRFVPATQYAAAAVAGTGSANDFERFTPINKDIIINGNTDTSMLVNIFGFTPDAKIVGDSAPVGEANYVGFHLIGWVLKGQANRANDLSNGQKCVVR